MYVTTPSYSPFDVNAIFSIKNFPAISGNLPIFFSDPLTFFSFPHRLMMKKVQPRVSVPPIGTALMFKLYTLPPAAAEQPRVNVIPAAPSLFNTPRPAPLPPTVAELQSRVEKHQHNLESQACNRLKLQTLLNNENNALHLQNAKMEQLTARTAQLQQLIQEEAQYIQDGLRFSREVLLQSPEYTRAGHARVQQCTAVCEQNTEAQLRIGEARHLLAHFEYSKKELAAQMVAGEHAKKIRYLHEQLDRLRLLTQSTHLQLAADVRQLVLTRRVVRALLRRHGRVL